MLSTHCSLEEWKGLDKETYGSRKTEIAERLLGLARRVYPNLGEKAAVFEVATPQTFERYTRRLRGAVGGFRLHPGNSNQRAIPNDIDIKGFWLGGDTTWPGLGTVACVLGSKAISRRVMKLSRNQSFAPQK
jgi:phytoene dehydrogenase-like protein